MKLPSTEVVPFDQSGFQTACHDLFKQLLEQLRLEPVEWQINDDAVLCG